MSTISTIEQVQLDVDKSSSKQQDSPDSSTWADTSPNWWPGPIYIRRVKKHGGYRAPPRENPMQTFDYTFHFDEDGAFDLSDAIDKPGEVYRVRYCHLYFCYSYSFI